MTNLRGKKILLFAPGSEDSYGYEVKVALESMGAEVKIYDERPSKSPILKILFRLCRKCVALYINRYFNNIVKENSRDNFDYIFVIRGEVFSKYIVRKLRKIYNKAIFILFLWESIECNDKRDLFSLFDKVFSFDKADVSKYNNLIFRPLFYLDEYRLLSDKTHEYDNDIIFIGTVYSDRYAFIIQLDDYFRNQNIKTYYYLLFKSRLLYLKERIFNKAFKSTKMKDFHYSSLCKMEVLRNVARSRVSLDIQHPKQTGLSIRCIEMLGAKRKLITTNSDIKTYDFYDKNNILIIDHTNINIDPDFIKSPYWDIDNVIYEKYSIHEWLNDIFKDI